MKKMLAAFTALSLCAAMCGCVPQYTDLNAAEAAGARLGECILIDGVDVSKMSPVEALAAVEHAHSEALKSMYYTVSAEDDSLDISASLLPVAFNTQNVILEALSLKEHWPRSNEPRKLVTTMGADAEALRAALAGEISPLEFKAQNAAAKYNGGRFTYEAHKTGRIIDIADLASKVNVLLASGAGGSIAALATAVEPEYTVEMAKADTQLVAEFSTSFAGSTYGRANRVFNIVKAASLIDGATVAPGGEFDMNAALGARNAKNGWKTATGIRDGIYVQEYGGGVCQVSSTLYNAVLMADLKVSERYHHSWPLGYVDIGRDATISTGGPNFKFINSHDAPVTISASVNAEEKTVTVKLFGRPLANGVTIELTSKKTATLSDPGSSTTVDHSLPAGTSKTVRKARRGSVAETYKLYYGADGKLIKEELVSEDKYRSIAGLIAVSPEDS